MYMFDVIGKRNYFLGFSGVMVLLALAAVVIFGFRPGIDLEGGTQWQVAFRSANPSEETIRAALANEEVEAAVKRLGEGELLIRLPSIGEEAHQKLLTALQAVGDVEEKNFASIGPAIGAELKQKALWAIAVVLFGISLYIAWAFRKVSKPVQLWKYGVVTLISLFHDVAIPAGLLAVLGRWGGVEFNTNSIVALLVVMGFSVHDTIVVFDRIRENLLLERRATFPLGDLVNKSVNETFARSVNTSLTLVIVLLALLAVGPPSLFYFVLTILIGTVFGTYSSIFVASPLLYLWGRGR